MHSYAFRLILLKVNDAFQVAATFIILVSFKFAATAAYIANCFKSDTSIEQRSLCTRITIRLHTQLYRQTKCYLREG